jgi:hypothetical protein
MQKVYQNPHLQIYINFSYIAFRDLSTFVAVVAIHCECRSTDDRDNERDNIICTDTGSRDEVTRPEQGNGVLL